MPIIDIFRKDKRYWTTDQMQEVELFFMLNNFYNKFYEHADFDQVVNLTFYAKIEPGQQARLELNKKSEIVILLNGVIEIQCKTFDNERRKGSKKKEKEGPDQNYTKMGVYRSPYELIPTRNDVIIKSKEQSICQFLFVPTMLYEAHYLIVRTRRVDTILEVLSKHFKDATKRELKSLAQSGCSFKQMIINNYIYRASTPPEYVYILLQGNIKLQVPGFSARKMMDMTILSPDTLFGDKDINQEQRIQNANCCSAHCRLMQITKQAYNRFVNRSPHLKPRYLQKINEMANQKRGRSSMDKHEERTFLPRLYRFHSFVKPDEEEKIQKEIVQNCHILINLTPKRRANSVFRSPEQQEKDYSVSQFKEKIKLFQRRRLNECIVDPTHKFF